MGKEPYLRGMWEHFSSERSQANKFRQLADEERQAAIQAQWQQESPTREYLEQVKCCHDTEWAFDRIKEAFDLVALDEARKVSVVQKKYIQEH